MRGLFDDPVKTSRRRVDAGFGIAIPAVVQEAKVASQNSCARPSPLRDGLNKALKTMIGFAKLVSVYLPH